MKLVELDIDGVRNLSNIKLKELGDINFFYGENGSGKTSVLEAIHLLALARSFRSTQLKPVIQYNKDSCTIFGKTQKLIDGGECIEQSLGILRKRSGQLKIRIDGNDIKSVVSLADALPLQLINASSYLLLEGGPKQRRQFLDWGVFHVEPLFYQAWRKAQRAIKQRNALLRSRSSVNQLSPWDNELLVVSEQIDKARSLYMQSFVPLFQTILQKLIELEGIEIVYFPGWNQEFSFAEELKRSLNRDLTRGLTHIGPHRADIKIKIHGIDAGQVLSRGQQKLLVSAMRLAQTELLVRQKQKQSILLIDDLPAEVDTEHQKAFCSVLDEINTQLFITCISSEQLTHFAWKNLQDPKWFHVKQDKIALD